MGEYDRGPSPMSPSRTDSAICVSEIRRMRLRCGSSSHALERNNSSRTIKRSEASATQVRPSSEAWFTAARMSDRGREATKRPRPKIVKEDAELPWRTIATRVVSISNAATSSATGHLYRRRRAAGEMAGGQKRDLSDLSPAYAERSCLTAGNVLRKSMRFRAGGCKGKAP